MSAEVWVYCGRRYGVFDKAYFELIGEGRKLADTLGTRLVAVLLGHRVKEMAQELVDYGADTVLVGEDKTLATALPQTYAKIVGEQINIGKPEIFLWSARAFDRDVAARVAIRAGTGLVSDCTEVALDKEQGFILAAKPVSDGIMGTFACTRGKPQMVSIIPGAFKPAKEAGRSGEIRGIPVDVGPAAAKVNATEIKTRSQCSLEDATVVVAGGRGVGKQVFELLGELAALLGGQVACTQGPVEEGWAPHEWMVGQTGKTVRPKLYVACGISGAVQHSSGMWDSQSILSINSDPNAPIFGISNFGIVGDCAQIVPALIKELKGTRQ